MYSLLKRVRARAGRVTGTRAPTVHVRSELSARALHKKEYARVRGELPARAPPIAHVRRMFPACALHKKEYVHVRGELPARAPPSRTCGGCSPRVRSTKKSTCTCGASCRHARPHRARAEDVPRVCAPQTRVRARVGRVTGTRTPIVRVRSRLSVRGRGIIYQKRVIFCNILLK